MRTHLRILRIGRGYTQARLAGLSGVPQSTISDLEAGKYERVDFDTVSRLVRALATTFEAFIDDDTDAATK